MFFPQFFQIKSLLDLDEPIDLIVTWNTINSTNEPSIVEYGIVENHLTETAIGSAVTFIDGGLARRQQFIHRVKLTGLLPKQKYCTLQIFSIKFKQFKKFFLY
jgi:hypothetical protein